MNEAEYDNLDKNPERDLACTAFAMACPLTREVDPNNLTLSDLRYICHAIRVRYILELMTYDQGYLSDDGLDYLNAAHDNMAFLLSLKNDDMGMTDAVCNNPKGPPPYTYTYEVNSEFRDAIKEWLTDFVKYPLGVVTVRSDTTSCPTLSMPSMHATLTPSHNPTTPTTRPHPNHERLITCPLTHTITNTHL